MRWWMKGMVKGYEGPNDMVSENGSQGPCFKGVQMPHTKDRTMEEKVVGKDARKWKYGAKAIVERK